MPDPDISEISNVCTAGTASKLPCASSSSSGVSRSVIRVSGTDRLTPDEDEDAHGSFGAVPAVHTFEISEMSGSGIDASGYMAAPVMFMPAQKFSPDGLVTAIHTFPHQPGLPVRIRRDGETVDPETSILLPDKIRARVIDLVGQSRAKSFVADAVLYVSRGKDRQNGASLMQVIQSETNTHRLRLRFCDIRAIDGKSCLSQRYEDRCRNMMRLFSEHSVSGVTVVHPRHYSPRDPDPDSLSVLSRKYNFGIEVPGQGLLPAVNIMTSRGCPFNCNFCATPINWGRTVRTRSPLNVVQEIEFLVEKYGARVIFFYDDTFNLSVKRVEEICRLILERRLPVFWRCEIRLDLMTKPLLTRMKEAGLFHVSFGLEAGSARVRENIIDKKIKLQDFHNVIAWCRELEIIPNVFFIFSHPTETWAEAQETIRIIEQYKDEVEATVAILHVYPGTPLERTARERGLLPAGFSWTKKHSSDIITLPTAQGDVPLFVDRLTWGQISELLFRWSFSGGRISIARKIPRVIANIRSWGDVKRYTIMAAVFLKLKWQRLFKKKAA